MYLDLARDTHYPNSGRLLIVQRTRIEVHSLRKLSSGQRPRSALRGDDKCTDQPVVRREARAEAVGDVFG